MPDSRAEAHEFCRRMRPRLVGTLRFLCADPGVAEELAQETLARVWLDWPKVARLGDPAASAWTYRVAVNLARSWFRRRSAERRITGRLGPAGRDRYDGPDSAAFVDLRVALARLPRRQRTALVLRYYADLPVAQVAELMGCAPGTVKALTNQALATLRTIIPTDRGASNE